MRHQKEEKLLKRDERWNAARNERGNTVKSGAQSHTAETEPL